MRTFVYFLCFLCASCVISSEYPNDWPDTSNSMIGDCPSISGRYKDIGVGSIEGEWSSLSATFLDSQDPTEGHILLEQVDSEALVVTVVSGGTSGTTRTLRRKENDFWCENEMLWITDVDKTLSVWGTAARGRDNTGFWKADDGSLVAEFDSKGGGLVFLIPVYGSVSSHFRWLAVE